MKIQWLKDEIQYLMTKKERRDKVMWQERKKREEKRKRKNGLSRTH
jgi:hypothetical protein